MCVEEKRGSKEKVCAEVQRERAKEVIEKPACVEKQRRRTGGMEETTQLMSEKEEASLRGGISRKENEFPKKT